MSLKNLCFFERLLSDKLHKSNNFITIIIIGGLLLILLSTLVGLAVIQSDELVEYDDISLVGSHIGAWMLGLFFLGSLSLGPELEVLAAILRLEYLRSHVGEKRPAGRAVGANSVSLWARFSKTALYSIVPSFLYIYASFVDDVNRLTKVFRSMSIYRISSKEKFQFMEVYLVMRRTVQFCLFKEKFLIQGDL